MGYCVRWGHGLAIAALKRELAEANAKLEKAAAHILFLERERHSESRHSK
jgi:hypothetical protein